LGAAPVQGQRQVVHDAAPDGNQVNLFGVLVLCFWFQGVGGGQLVVVSCQFPVDY
jgi:hypothetical protein